MSFRSSVEGSDIRMSEYHRFHVDVAEALFRAAPAAFAFTCIGLENTTAFRCVRSERGSSTPGPAWYVARLADAFPLDRAAPSIDRGALEIARRSSPPALDHSVAIDGKNLLVHLHSAGSSYGVAGLQRAADDPDFSSDEIAQVGAAAELIRLTARLQVGHTNLICENAALRALGEGDGLFLMIDRERQEILWASRRGHDIVWERDVEPITAAVIQATCSGDVSSPLPLHGLSIHGPDGARVITISEADGSALGVSFCAAVRVRASLFAATLSLREQEVASMLANGYANVNIAASMGVSENTIRTYVRRLYRKLRVCSRVQLTRVLLSQEGSMAGDDGCRNRP